MKIYSLVPLLLLLVSNETTAQKRLCTPGEERQPHNITLNCTGETVFWFKDNSQIITCQANRCQENRSFGRYNQSVSSSASTLIIYNVTRQSLGTYKCRARTLEQTCDFKVYAKPTSVSCQQAVFEGDAVTVACTVKRIYPNPVCRFVWTTNGTANQISPEQISYENLTDAADPDYFNVQCRLNLPVLKLSKGSHQFGVLVYPNVTGRDSDSIYGINSDLTHPQSVAYPNVVLESCPETYVVEGSHFSCTCRETANVFIPAKTTLVYGSDIVMNAAVANVTGTFTANRDTHELGCQAKLKDGTSVVVKHKLLIAFGPTITSFEVNNEAVQTIVQMNSDVTFTCRAVGNPSPRLSLQKNGQEMSNFSDPLQTEATVLTFRHHVTKCTDAGVYQCVAETHQQVANQTIEVHIPCAFQLESSENQNKVYKARMKRPFYIAITVFGYPDPSLKLEGSTYSMEAGTYELFYVKGTAPFGVILIRINNVTNGNIQSYIVSAVNAEGTLSYRFSLENEDHGAQRAEPTSNVNVGGVAGGIVAAVLVTVATATVIIILKRKGLFMKRWLSRNRDDEPSQPSGEYIEVSSSHYGSQIGGIGDMAQEHHLYDEISFISSGRDSNIAPQPFPASRNVTSQYENVISD